MENGVSSTFPDQDAAMARAKRLKEKFKKDYQSLHNFLRLMEEVESANVEVANNAIEEKHNESIRFLKNAICEAQSYVLSEAAKQRKEQSPSKFAYFTGTVKPPGVAGASEAPSLLLAKKARSTTGRAEPTPRFLASLKSVAAKSADPRAKSSRDAKLDPAPSTPLSPSYPDLSNNVFRSKALFVALNSHSSSKNSTKPKSCLDQDTNPQSPTNAPISHSLSNSYPEGLGITKKIGIRPASDLASSVKKKAKFSSCDIDIGTVVLAKYLNYPFWPGLVVSIPEDEMCKESFRRCKLFRVKFWEGVSGRTRTSFANIDEASVVEWKDRESAEDRVPRNRRRRDWEAAIDIAEEMFMLTMEERFWKIVLIEERLPLDIEYRPNRGTEKINLGDVVIVDKKKFDPGLVSAEDTFAENLDKTIYSVSGYLHVSFFEDGTHGWYPMREVWILKTPNDQPWGLEQTPRMRKSVEKAVAVFDLPVERREEHVGAWNE